MAVAALKFTGPDYAAAVKFLNGRTSKPIGNNTVLFHDAHRNQATIEYHGNVIATFTPDGLTITDAGWPTTTTTGRLHQFTIRHGIGVNRQNGHTNIAARYPGPNKNHIITGKTVSITGHGTWEVVN